MSLSEFPITVDETDYRISVILDGVRYHFRFHYNRRIDTWFVDLEDSNQNIIIVGIPALTNVQNMFTRFAKLGVLTTGDMIILDSAGTGLDPTRTNFGQIVSAFYHSIAELL